MKQKTNEQIAMQVSVITMLANAVLTVLKLIAGFLSASGAMISDAVHSASDVGSTVVVMIGVKLAGRESDDDHPYGHERLECVAAILLSVMLALTGAGIGLVGVKKIFGAGDALTVPGGFALVAAIISVAAKEGMYWYTRAAAKKIDSSALMADAWHHRSDALSSVGSFVGILGARMGLPILDPIASVVICLFIFKAAYDIFMDAVGKMTDMAAPAQTQDAIRELVSSQEGVLAVDSLTTRLFGDRIYVDVEIAADGDSTLRQAHDVAQRVHDEIEEKFPKVKHCNVHVNPYEEVET